MLSLVCRGEKVVSKTTVAVKRIMWDDNTEEKAYNEVRNYTSDCLNGKWANPAPVSLLMIEMVSVWRKAAFLHSYVSSVDFIFTNPTCWGFSQALFQN